MTAPRPKRSLLLAGGGMKVAFQAGVLQVLLDEAGLEFDHVDACSGGVLNAVLLCEGRSGRQIADTWRRTRPLDGLSVRRRDWFGFPYGRSLVTLDSYRRKIFPSWGLDWEAVRSSPVPVTVNAFDITGHRLRTFTPDELSEEVLCACISLPVWFPPVAVSGRLYTDAVFVTDANLEEAIDRGAEEIWIVWTVSRRDEWFPGLVAQFFHALETSANGHLQRMLDRIGRNNEDIAAGRAGQFGRPIVVKELHAEVPVHYLAVLGADRLHRAVERGVEAARRWCRDEGVPFTPVPPDPAPTYADGIGLRFRDAMHGLVVPTPADDAAVLQDAPLRADLELVIPDVGRFVTDPAHVAVVEGTVSSPVLGGEATVERGSAGILVDDGVDPTRKQMRYRLFLRGADDRHHTLVGLKTVDSGALGRLWSDTTTMSTQLLRGHVEEGLDAPLAAAGTLRMGVRGVGRQLLTARATGPGLRRRLRGTTRFGTMFVGHLWDVYGRRVLTYAPF